MLPVSVARLISDDNAICEVFPVHWMTSRFHIICRTCQARPQCPHADRNWHVRHKRMLGRSLLSRLPSSTSKKLSKCGHIFSHSHSPYLVVKQIWLQFLCLVTAAALEQQISKFYPQIRCTKNSYHIYISQQPKILMKFQLGHPNSVAKYM